jgi:hypothetical protein
MATSGNKSKHSQRNQNRGERIDMLALSPVARRQTVLRVPIGDFTQSTTNKWSRGALGFAGTLIAAYLSAKTAPVGGVLSTRVVAYDASANAEINLTNTVDPEAVTVREGTAMVLATTNVELAADDTIEIHNIADGSAVSQQQVDGYVTLVFERKEDTTIVD